jgi:protein gp37
MAKDWWTYSWNLAVGCSKVSTECQHCWAEVMAKRLKAMGRAEYQDVVNDHGHWTNRVTLVNDRIGEPLRLKKPRVIAVNLMGDLFHPAVPLDFQESVFDVMRQANWHVFLILTKRPEQMLAVVNRLGLKAENYVNVWLGTSAGNQAGANERRDSMWALAQMGFNTWVSSEPRIGEIDWTGWEFLKWMATGGESGNDSRPMDPNWARSDLDWCRAHDVKFMFKQWGEYVPLDHLKVSERTTFKHRPVEVGGTVMVRVGKSAAGHVLDGNVYRWYPSPADMRIWHKTKYCPQCSSVWDGFFCAQCGYCKPPRQ